MQEFPIFKVPLVPCRFAQLFRDYLVDNHLSREEIRGYDELLQSCCLDSHQSLSLDQVSGLLACVSGSIDGTCDGFKFGKTIDLACLGVIGYISSTQDNPLQQLVRVTQLMNTSLPLFSFSIQFDEKCARLVIDNSLNLDGLMSFLLFAYLGCIYRICRTFSRINTINVGNQVTVDFSKIKILAPGVNWLSGGQEVSVTLTDIHFNQSEKSAADLSHSPLNNGRQDKRSLDDHIVAHVAEIVKESPGRMTIVRCAERFNVSSRYLRYKLEEHGITFREIKAKVLQEQANLYLFHSRLSISDISFKLGFANHASFSRAYKAVTGLPPGENRRMPMIERER